MEEKQNKECPFCGNTPEWYYEGETLWCVTDTCPLKGLIFSEEEWNDRYNNE